MVTTFSDKTDAELYRYAQDFAVIEERFAAEATDEPMHQHHLIVRDLIMELAKRLVR